MNKLKTLAAAAALVLGLGSNAQAVLVDITGPIIASGPVTAVFLFEEAIDTSNLTASAPGIVGNQVLFLNQTDPVGKTVVLANTAGAITFTLNNFAQGYSFVAGVLDAVDGLYHARTSSNFADFGVGPLSAAGAAALSGLGSVTFVGFEDRRGGDYDYNDLIYAFTSVTASVPAPGALLLFGAALLGLGVVRRRV